MKDKRQRMAMAWPYGIADPHLYAYLAAAAASYPYGFSQPGTNPFSNYYSSLGMQRPPQANSLSQYTSFPNPLRPNSEILPGMSGNIVRKPSPVAMSHNLQTSPPIGCSNMHPALDNAPSMTGHPVPCASHGTENCSCAPMQGGLSTIPSSLSMTQAPKAHSNTTSQGLFRPFQTDER